MKIKRIAFFLAAVIMCVILGGCGDDTAEKIKNSVKIGIIAQLNTTPEQMDEVMQVMGVDTKTTYYDNFTSMLMALSSNQIDEIQTYKSVAKYMNNQNSGYKIKNTVNLVDAFCCAMRDEDVQLRNSFDNAIESMQADGTLDALITTYINDLSGEPKPVDIAHIDGANTIKVGITGDLPPLDLVLADGTPAGFNTAVLSEISKRINENIELIQIDSGARAAALISKEVDVIFWVVVPADNSNRPADFDKPAGISVTVPYYQDQVVDVNLGAVASGMAQ